MSDCVICLDDLINVENGSIVALQCGHVLHQTCLASMVMNSNDSKCPICRLSIQGVLPLFLGSGSHGTRSEDDKEAAAVFCQTANAIFAQTTGLDVLQQECRELKRSLEHVARKEQQFRAKIVSLERELNKAKVRELKLERDLVQCVEKTETMHRQLQESQLEQQRLAALLVESHRERDSLSKEVRECRSIKLGAHVQALLEQEPSLGFVAKTQQEWDMSVRVLEGALRDALRLVQEKDQINRSLQLQIERHYRQMRQRARISKDVVLDSDSMSVDPPAGIIANSDSDDRKENKTVYLVDDDEIGNVSLLPQSNRRPMPPPPEKFSSGSSNLTMAARKRSLFGRHFR